MKQCKVFSTFNLFMKFNEGDNWDLRFTIKDRRVFESHLTYAIAVKFFSRYVVRENFDRKVIFSGSFQSSEQSEQSRIYIKGDISFSRSLVGGAFRCFCLFFLKKKSLTQRKQKNSPREQN